MAHLHEKIDFTSSVYVVKDDAVLLHKHHGLGIWLQPGGHIEFNQDPNQAAIQEVLEESGLQIELVGNPRLPGPPHDKSTDLIPPMFLNRHHVNETHEHVDFVYFGKVLGGELRPEFEGGQIQWVSRKQILDNDFNLLDSVRSYALAALDYFARQQ